MHEISFGMRACMRDLDEARARARARARAESCVARVRVINIYSNFAVFICSRYIKLH